jgi:RHS repeat-associated protein
MPPLPTFYYLCQINPQKIMEMLRCFYHHVHASTGLSTGIGSSASRCLSNLWITDGTGQAIQHLHYLPFGEDWVDQRNTSWNAPYTFSGKEKDLETGYGYFGARYYDSGLSIWLSVDPMSDKYPSMSPYNYCANNPVILVDPDGRKIIVSEFTNADGSRTITITYTAYIRNVSNIEISNDEMAAYITRIKSSIEAIYSGNPEDNTQTTVNTSVDIQILPETTRHIISIANLPPETPGLGETNGMEMFLDVRLLENAPTNQTTGMCETSTNGIRNTLEKVAAHEFGHNSGLLDYFGPNMNIMKQDDQTNLGVKFNNSQIDSMIQCSNWRNRPANDCPRSSSNTRILNSAPRY